MGRRRGFTLVELMVVVAILGILMAIALPLYLSYMTGAKINAAIDNYNTLVRAAKSEAARRNVRNDDGAANILAICDPNLGAPGAKRSPMDITIPAYAQGAAPAGDGQVVISVTDFTRATTPPGTWITVSADTTNNGAGGVDLTCNVLLE